MIFRMLLMLKFMDIYGSMAMEQNWNANRKHRNIDYTLVDY